MSTAALWCAVFFCYATGALAQEVTITTESDGLTLTGRIVSFDGHLLQLDSAYGLLTLDYAKVDCVGAACPDAETHVPVVRLSGAARMGNVMMPALIEAYGRDQGWQATTTAEDAEHLTVTLLDDTEAPQAHFKLRLSSTDEGFADLIAFEADMVMALREVRETEATHAAQVGLGDITDPRQARIIGYDALVPVVNPGVGLRHIALWDVARAYQGSLSNWGDLDGLADLPISLHMGPKSGGPWQFFLDHVVQANDGTVTAAITRHAQEAEVATAVATTPGGLGLLPYGETGNSRPVALRDACGFTAVPQNVTLKTQDYPLTEPLFLYVPDRVLPLIMRDFLSFLRGPEAQLVVRRAGFVDQGAVPIPLDAQGQRFANAIDQAGAGVTLGDLQRMVRTLTPLTRLSTSFRFDTTGEQLDAPSRSHLMALGQAIRDGRYDGQRFVLVGFGDEGENARRTSITRANAVKAALIAALGTLPPAVTVETTGFGAALPMGCNDTPWGRARNNRVELWVDQDG